MDRDFPKIKIPISLRQLNAQREAIESMARVNATVGMNPGNVISQSGSGLNIDSTLYQPFWARITGRGPAFTASLVMGITADVNYFLVRYVPGRRPPIAPFHAYFGTETIFVMHAARVDAPSGDMYAWLADRGRLGTRAKAQDANAVIEANISYAFQEVAQDTPGHFRPHTDGRHSEPLQPETIMNVSGNAYTIGRIDINVPAFEASGIKVPVDGSAIAKMWLGETGEYYTFTYFNTSKPQPPPAQLCVSMAANPSFSACVDFEPTPEDPDKYSSWSVDMTTKPKVEGKISKDDPRIQSTSEADFSSSLSDNYPLWPHQLLKANVTTACTLSGIAPKDADSVHVDGLMAEIMNVGTQNMTLAHEDSASDSANQISIAGSTDITLRPKDTIALKYVASDEKWWPLWQTSEANTFPAKIFTTDDQVLVVDQAIEFGDSTGTDTYFDASNPTRISFAGTGTGTYCVSAFYTVLYDAPDDTVFTVSINANLRGGANVVEGIPGSYMTDSLFRFYSIDKDDANAGLPGATAAEIVTYLNLLTTNIGGGFMRLMSVNGTTKVVTFLVGVDDADGYLEFDAIQGADATLSEAVVSIHKVSDTVIGPG